MHKFFLGIAIVGMLSSMPLTGFAKENGRNKGDDDDNKAKVEINKNKSSDNNKGGDDRDDDEKSDKGCFRAFGHLIAPGWIKHNDRFSFGDECNLPFGIGRKFRGDHSTTTPPLNDVTPPIISGVSVSNTTKTQVTVNWTTDERSDSAIFISTTSPVNASSTVSAFKNGMTQDHRIVLRRLAAGTTYFGIVRSRDKSGNVAFSSQFSFTTVSSSTDNTAPVINGIVTVSGTTTIQVGWHTNESATSRVYFGPLPVIDTNASTTLFVDNATLVQNHLISLNSLATSTRYYMIVESADSAGNVSLSPVFSASTTAATSTSM